MDIILTQEEKAALEQQHRGARDKRVAGRIEPVLLKSEGWSPEQIRQALTRTHYHPFKASTPVDEPIVFMDAVHPTMATKVSHGWIRKGQRPLKTHYPQAKQTLAQQEEAITLHYLPSSPHLNLIERLWKFMDEHARNNRVFASPAAFRDAMTQFFALQLSQLTYSLHSRITDHFQILTSVPSG